MAGQFRQGVGQGWRGDLGYVVCYKAELANRFPGASKVWDSRVERNLSQQRGSKCVCQQTHQPGVGVGARF